MKGGYRAGARRKKGFSAIRAEEARAYISGRVESSLEPIIDSLIDRAVKGDISATRELFDRAWGKAQTQIALSDDRESSSLLPMEYVANVQRAIANVYGNTAGDQRSSVVSV